MRPPQWENRQWTLQVGSCISVLVLIRQASLKDGHKAGPKVFFVLLLINCIRQASLKDGHTKVVPKFFVQERGNKDHLITGKRESGALRLLVNTVEPPPMTTSQQQPPFYNDHFFLVDSPFIESCVNLSTMATLFCPQDGFCGEVQLYAFFFQRWFAIRWYYHKNEWQDHRILKTGLPACPQRRNS